MNRWWILLILLCSNAVFSGFQSSRAVFASNAGIGRRAKGKKGVYFTYPQNQPIANSYAVDNNF